MPEPVLLGLALLVAGAFVLAPLWRPTAEPDDTEGALESALLQHRSALEALRDLEADRRAGSLDPPAYAEQLTEAEARAAATRAALEQQDSATPRPPSLSGASRGRALAVAGVIGVALVVGSTIPATGIANATQVNEQLAAAQLAESARQQGISALLERLQADPRDEAVVSDLADAYLAGSTADDLVRAAVALRLLIDVDPQRADAYERILTAYLRAGDYANARAALDSYATLQTADQVELAFFEGLIALRGESDHIAAREAFDRFLELAPDDPRAGMVRGLRDEAAAP